MQAPVLLMVFDKDQIRQLSEDFSNDDIHHYEKRVAEFRNKTPLISLAQKKINQHILLASDFSDSSEYAFQWIKNQIRHIPRLTLMHIQDIARITKHLEDRLDEFNRIDTVRLNRLKEEFSRSHPETQINIELAYGNPKQLILQFIGEQKVTLAVLGSQGRGYISEFFVGSVSLHVARHANSNVLLIPFRESI